MTARQIAAKLDRQFAREAVIEDCEHLNVNYYDLISESNRANQNVKKAITKFRYGQFTNSGLGQALGKDHNAIWNYNRSVTTKAVKTIILKLMQNERY